MVVSGVVEQRGSGVLTCMGIKGYFATRFSVKTKKPISTTPKMIKQMTVGELQGNVTPPKSKPIRIISVTPTIAKVPNQSKALNPSRMPVRGLCTSSRKNSVPNETAQIGRFTQKHHRQLAYCVNAPPSNGPTPPASPQQTFVRPRNIVRRRMLNRSDITINASWFKPPAPVPCNARAAMRTCEVRLRAAMMLDAKNITTAESRASLRPQISLNFAQMGPEAALARK